MSNRRGIATVSLSGVLADKLGAAAEAGFDGVELFDNDLISSPLSPREVARRCADLGLAIDLFQPVRDVEGVPPERFPAVLHRLRVKLAVMSELGTSTLLACSNVAADAVDDLDLTAEQLRAVGELAASYGVTVAFEALAWGRHIDRVGRAWEAVVRADHPAVTLAVDTFHVLARGDDGSALADVPGDRIGFLQVADAPLLEMNVLEWSRHFRCFPGEGTLDVTGVVAATLDAGYRGPVSLEVFSDLVREADPRATARDGMRSLLYLEEQVARRRGRTTAVPPAPRRIDPAFLEVSGTDGGGDLGRALTALGFAVSGRHRTKPVVQWRNGKVHVVVNASSGAPDAALGVVAAPVPAVADRAKALLWPAVDRTRGSGEAYLPGITSPSGLHVFVSDEPGGEDDWHGDFDRTLDGALDGPGEDDSAGPGLLGIDHVAVAVPADRLDEEVAFYRTLFGLAPGPVEEFMEPHGRLRSRALRPRTGGLRIVLNVEEVGEGATAVSGITQVAFACRDVAAEVRRLRGRGVALMPVPDNYYVDLDARFGLDRQVLAELREHHLLYDRIGEGELRHAYTAPLPSGFHVELVERRHGYDGYGSAGTHVRLAMQRAAG